MPAPDRPPWILDTLTLAANRVRGSRIDRDVTQEELAERTGLTVRTIQRIETGREDYMVSNLALIAHALNVHIADLLT